MEKKEILRKIEECTDIYKDLEKKIDLDFKCKRIEELETITNNESFWNAPEKTKDVIQELKNLNSIAEKFKDICDRLSLVNEMIS